MLRRFVGFRRSDRVFAATVSKAPEVPMRTRPAQPAERPGKIYSAVEVSSGYAWIDLFDENFS